MTDYAKVSAPAEHEGKSGTFVWTYQERDSEVVEEGYVQLHVAHFLKKYSVALTGPLVTEYIGKDEFCGLNGKVHFFPRTEVAP